MSKAKFTKGPLTPFEIESENFYHNYVEYGIEDKDKDKTVLCWATGGPKETRKANVNLWAVSPEMYDFIHFFETFTGQGYLRILPPEVGNKIYEEAVRLCKKARSEE